MAVPDTTVAGYLLHRLFELGIRHLFGVPGDFVLGFLNQVLASQVLYVGTCNELNAAYAADGYARIRGIGALVTTFGVGELSALNGVAGAFAERVPVVVITGAPATLAFLSQARLHHTLGDYDIPARMFESITVAQARLDSATTAGAEIDRVLTACLVHRQPVYLRVPADLVSVPCRGPEPFEFPVPAPSDPSALAEAVDEAARRLGASRRPVVVAGVDLNRFGFHGELAAFLAATGYPYVTKMLGKAVLSEHHPQFVGLYEGDRSRPEVLARVGTADVVVQVGNWETDFNTGGFTERSDLGSRIMVDLRSVTIAHHVYPEVTLPDFLQALGGRLSHRDPGALDIPRASEGCLHRPGRGYVPRVGVPLTVSRLFDRLSRSLGPGTVLVAETGVALFGAAEMLLPDGATFLGQAFYGSIGYAVPASLGASLAAVGRPVALIVGDGAFQVTGQELSTLIRHRLAPLVVVINNGGYTTERAICDRSFNDLQPWRYHRLPEAFGGRGGRDVFTEEDLEGALEAALGSSELLVIEVHTDPWDYPESLKSAGRAMALANHLEDSQ